MVTIILTFNIIAAILLVIAILFQKSEGGALGIGASQEKIPTTSVLEKIEEKQDMSEPQIPE